MLSARINAAALREARINLLPSEALVTELQDHVKKVTAPYKYPRVIEFVSELPKTISGKIRRVAAREFYERGPSSVKPSAGSHRTR